LSLNFVGFFLSSLVVGPWSDSYGRRPILLGGAFLFVLGSLACVLATNLPWLLLGRFIQGLGVSAPSILACASTSWGLFGVAAILLLMVSLRQRAFHAPVEDTGVP